MAHRVFGPGQLNPAPDKCRRHRCDLFRVLERFLLSSELLGASAQKHPTDERFWLELHNFSKVRHGRSEMALARLNAAHQEIGKGRIRLERNRLLKSSPSLHPPPK